MDIDLEPEFSPPREEDLDPKPETDGKEEPIDEGTSYLI